MNKKKRREIIELSLLENPNMETQVKEKTGKVVLRAIFISVLFLLIISGYIFKFSANLVPKFINNYYVGTFSASNFYGANDCDLIIIKPYENNKDTQIGDIICYKSNLTKGSGKVVSKSGDVVTIETAEGNTKRISYSSILGEQHKNIAVLGFFIEFVNSYYGIATFTIILLAYVAYITFGRINFENTNQGKLLYKKFRFAQKEERNRLKLLKKVRKIQGLDYVIVSMLDGNFEENKQKLIEFNSDAKISIKDNYKYVLSEIHKEYLPKSDLSREEKKRITSLIELICLTKDFDLDIEYMAVDLLLKTHLTNFDTKSFSKYAIEFLSSSLDDDDLLNFGSVLYILLYRNRKYRNELKLVGEKFAEIVEGSTNIDKSLLIGVSKTIINLIK